jgi:hypothetical protein
MEFWTDDVLDRPFVDRSLGKQLLERERVKISSATKTFMSIFSCHCRKCPLSTRQTAANLQSTIIRLSDR